MREWHSWLARLSDKEKGDGSNPSFRTTMEEVVHLVERQVVALEVKGSKPFFLPILIVEEIIMNALKAHQKYRAEKEHEEFLKRQQEEQEAYEKMTPEEKEKYNREKTARRKRMFQVLGLAAAVASAGGDYGSQIFDPFRDLD